MTFRVALLVTIAAAASALCPRAACAAAAPGINPTADTFVSSANPANNYGAAGALAVSASATGKGELDTFIRFNLATTKTYFDGIYGAGNWTVQSITLQLTTSTPNNAIFNNLNVAGMFAVTSMQSANADAWAEGTGSPNTPDTTGTLNYSNHTTYLGASDQGLGNYSFGGGTTGATTYTLTLSGGLSVNVQAGSDTNFYLSAADAAVSYVFNSTNFGTAASRPVLIVNAIPEPGTVTMFSLAAGLLALGFVRGRRRA